METTNMSPKPVSNRKRELRILLGGIVLTLSTMTGVSAWAQPHAGHDRGPGVEHGMGGGLMGGDPERMGKRIDHMLDGVNASDAQRAQIKKIAQAAAADMKTQREAGRALREKGLQIFTAPSVDASAAEQLRQQMLGQHDQMSKRRMAAMLEISKVLTPEQRAKLGERMKQRGDMMRDRMQRMERERPKQ